MSGMGPHHDEWLNLMHRRGPFVEPPVLIRVFPQGLPRPSSEKVGRLRAAYKEWVGAQEGGDKDAATIHATWIQLCLNELLEFDDQTLRGTEALPPGLEVRIAEHHEVLRPTMAIVEPTGSAKAGVPRLLITTWPWGQELEAPVSGVTWVASPLERMTQLCRGTGVRLGLVTDGERWTVVDARINQTVGFAGWDAGIWFQEPLTLSSFEALLGVRRFFAVAETDTLEAMLDESLAYQQDVTDQLGYQVRRAVEVLVQALDRADLDRGRELLNEVSPDRLYEASVTVMMRLVFLFCAEERGLFVLGDETYDTNYAVSPLRAQLRQEADQVGVEVLERRQDSWARLLATCRVVYGGIEHEALRIPAFGGSLFDPDRFPFLEGRAAGTSWLDTPASPLPIDNRTVLHLLEALQLLRMRGDDGTEATRNLSYRELDIEQIGHVYEGLLDHVAIRVHTATLGLVGTKDKEPELPVDELDRERRGGKDPLVSFLKEQTGRSASALRNALDAAPDQETEQRLLIACGNDKGLVKRLMPYHALLRDDAWGYPQIYRAGSFMVTAGPERRQTGTHYTPRSLTEQIVAETLEPLVYIGPAQGRPRDAWTLRSPAELLNLKVCDIAMGSGAFLVQVCRWLGERVVEAWEDAYRTGGGNSADRDLPEKPGGHDLLPMDREERLILARRLVAERCVYGVDINPMAVELAKLSLWLVTLAKGRPFGFLDHNLRSGDSLVGVQRVEQLLDLNLLRTDTVLQARLFGQRIAVLLAEASRNRAVLLQTKISDIEDVREMEERDGEARKPLAHAVLVADALVGATLGLARKPQLLRAALDGLAFAAEHLTSGDEKAAQGLLNEATAMLSPSQASREDSRRPFHWCLEFPEVFSRSSPGFDAVLGNPPYLNAVELCTGPLAQQLKSYYSALYSAARGSYDMYVLFVERGMDLARRDGIVGVSTILCKRPS